MLSPFPKHLPPRQSPVVISQAYIMRLTVRPLLFFSIFQFSCSCIVELDKLSARVIRLEEQEIQMREMWRNHQLESIELKRQIIETLLLVSSMFMESTTTVDIEPSVLDFLIRQLKKMDENDIVQPGVPIVHSLKVILSSLPSSLIDLLPLELKGRIESTVINLSKVRHN